MANTVVDFNTLVSEMSGKDSLGDFDVLVTYDEVMLNKLLANNSAQFNDVETLKLDCAYRDPATGNKVKTSVDFKLANPKLQFTDDGHINLTFDFAGTYGTAKVEIPKHVSLQLSAALIAAHGQVTGEKETSAFAATTGAATGGQETVMVFDTAGTYVPGNSPGIGICLDFSDAIVSIIATPVEGAEKPDQGDLDFLETMAATTIKNHFDTTKSKKLYLAAVKTPANNAPSTGADVLKPQAFCFSITPADSSAKTAASLSMWIAVDNGAKKYNGGEKKSLTFHPQSANRNPIPKGSTASVIFSNQIFLDHIVKPGLSGMSGVTNKSALGTSGLILGFKFPGGDAGKFYVKGVHDHSAYGSDEVADINFWMDQTEATMTFPATIGSDPSVVWESPDLKLEWSHTTKPMNGGIPVYWGGTVHMKFHLSFNGKWSVTNNEISVSWTSPTKFSPVDMKADSKDFWDKVLGGSEEIPSQYRDANPKVPAFSINFHPMYYFTTTNLILPGQHIFKPDPPSTGLAMPRDLIITGSTEAPVTTVRAMAAAPLEYVTNAITAVTNGSISNGLALPNPLNRGKREVDLIPDLLDTSSKLLGELLVASADPKDPEAAALAILDKQGYGQLKAEQFLKLLNVKLDDVVPVKANGIENQNNSTLMRSAFTNGISNVTNILFATPAAPFDVRTFAGFYSITGSVNRELVVNAQSGNITIDGIDSVTTVTVDSTGSNVVAWTTATGVTYSVIFTSTVKEGKFIASFSGTFKPSTAGVDVTGTAIAGTQKLPAAAESNRIMSDKSSDIVSIVGFVLGDLFGFIGVVGLGFAVAWRRDDKKEGKSNKDQRDKVQEILEMNNKAMVNNKAQVDLGIKYHAEHKATKTMRSLDWSTLKDKMQKDVKEAIRDKVDSLTAEQLAEMKAGTSPHTQELVDTANKAVAESVRNHVIMEGAHGDVKGSLEAFKAIGVLDSDGAEAMTKLALEPGTTSKLKELTETLSRGANPRTLVQDSVHVLISSRRLEVQQTELLALQTKAATINNDIATSSASITAKEKELSRAEKAKEAFDPTKPEWQVAEEARKKIDKDLQDLRESHNEMTEAAKEAKETERKLEAERKKEKTEKETAEKELRKREAEHLKKPHH